MHFQHWPWPAQPASAGVAVAVGVAHEERRAHLSGSAYNIIVHNII